MLYNKNICNIICFIFLCKLIGQPVEKGPKTYFFGLIKIDSDSPYEDGYWLNKWFFSREFASPVNIVPIELRYGFGVTGKSKGTIASFGSKSFKDDPGKIRYEGDAIPISQGINNLYGTSIELDMGLVNIPSYAVGTSWINVLTGVSYRTSTLVFPAEIPAEEWGLINASWDREAFFSPKLNEYLITTHFQYQPFNNWYINFRYGYGLASALFYSPDRTEQTWDQSLKGSGSSSAGAIGLRFIFDTGLKNRFSIGFDVRHSYTKIHNINDPDEITPITRFDLSNYGVYVSLSAFYGGRKTIGDKAKIDYYRKDYIKALKKFKQFSGQFPSHSNSHRAEKYIADCEYKIPYKLMKQGLVLEESGKFNKALNMYQIAKSNVKNDSIVYDMINKRIEQIALLWMIRAEEMLNEGNYITAYNLVKTVSNFSIQGQKEIRRFKSWVILGEGKQYQELGFIGRAMGKYSEALELNTDLIYEIRSLQYQAGIQMARLADEADEFEEIQVAIYALETARELAGGIGSKNEKLLIDLKEKIKKLDDYKTRGLIDKRMDLGRYELLKARSDRLEVGLTVPQVEDLLGSPHEKILGNDGKNYDQQLWIYFMGKRSLHLSFHNFQLFKIEKL
tara:strand:- start:372 stop:2231 length:1860 start_codon:yes stop_codon:yes gene_type:complete